MLGIITVATMGNGCGISFGISDIIDMGSLNNNDNALLAEIILQI